MSLRVGGLEPGSPCRRLALSWPGWADMSASWLLSVPSVDLAAGVLVLAVATGFAAFFSPCSFPLLLTFLTRRSAESPTSAYLSALRVAAGAALLLAVSAVIIAVGGTAVGGVVEFDSTAGRLFRLGGASVLVLFGLRQARLWGGQDAVAGSSGGTFSPPVRSGSCIAYRA